MNPVLSQEEKRFLRQPVFFILLAAVIRLSLLRKNPVSCIALGGKMCIILYIG